MIDEVILGFCFDIHRSVKTGAWQDSHLTGEEEPPLSIAGHVDVIGLPVSLTQCVNHHWAALPKNNSADQLSKL